MVIHGIQQTLQGVWEITPDAGSAFFLRSEYLTHLSENDLFELKGELTEAQGEDILNAALSYSAEVAAMSYLARMEHCRFGLYQKLIKKGIDKNAVNCALDYLESINYLSDERFAGAWLRSRSIDHYEGRIKLSSELAARGVEKDACKKALDEFFQNHDQLELCEKAYKKLLRTQRDENKIKASLMRNGFSYGEIASVLKLEK